MRKRLIIRLLSTVPRHVLAILTKPAHDKKACLTAIVEEDNKPWENVAADR